MMKLRNILLLLAPFLWLQSCGATENVDTFTEWGMLYGSVMTREACDHPDTSVWVSTAGRGECIRYFHSGLDRSNDIVHVWLHGDRMGQSFSGERRAKSYLDAMPWQLQMQAESRNQETGIPYIRLSRPGTYGSSGFHDQRRRPRNVETVLAAFDALKEKYSIKRFAVSGQSGGGHLVGALLANRNDIVCAVSTSGGLAVEQRIRAKGWLMDITGYSDFYDPIDHVDEIPRNKKRRIFIVGDPQDTEVPFHTQASYFERVKEHGHDVFLIKGVGGGRSRHNLDYAGFEIIDWCVDEVPSDEILKRARWFAPDE